MSTRLESSPLVAIAAHVFSEQTPQARQTSGGRTFHRIALANDLRTQAQGEVRFSDGDRGLYASGAGNYRMIPIGLILPRNIDDVMRTVAICGSYGAPLLARGGGVGIPGQSVDTAVMLDFSKYMNAIVELNPEQKHALVQPGMVLDELRNSAQNHTVTFGPDPEGPQGDYPERAYTSRSSLPIWSRTAVAIGARVIAGVVIWKLPQTLGRTK
jgi:hypothetical protein